MGPGERYGPNNRQHLNSIVSFCTSGLYRCTAFPCGEGKMFKQLEHSTSIVLVLVDRRAPNDAFEVHNQLSQSHSPTSSFSEKLCPLARAEAFGIVFSWADSCLY